MSITRQQYIDALQLNYRQYLIKIELLDFTENVIRTIEEDFISGNVQVEFKNGSRRTATITLANIDNKYTPNAVETNGIWMNNKVRIYTGMRVNGEDYFNSQGIFVIGEVDVNSNFGEKTITFNLYDKMAWLDGTISGKLQQDYIIADFVGGVQQTVGDAVLSLMQIADPTISVKPLIYEIPTINNVTVTIPYSLVLDKGTTYFEGLEKLAEMVTYQIYYNSDGFPVFEPLLEPMNLSSIWNFNNIQPLYRGGNHKFDYAKVKNSFIVYGDTVSGTLYSGIAKDEVVGSPTRLNLIGTRTEIINDDIIYSNDLALQRAKYELRKSISYYESVNAKCNVVDIIKEGSVVSVIDEAMGLEVSTRYQVQSFNLPLRMSEEMTLTLWQIRPLVDS